MELLFLSLRCTWIIGLSHEADSTLKNRGFMPACTIGSASFVSNTRRSDSMVCRGALRPLVVVGSSGTLPSAAKSTHLSIVAASPFIAEVIWVMTIFSLICT